jgi:dTDP-4-amino-4,6-dideoxygalactose transaminase
MLTAISRYGARVLPNTDEIIDRCRLRGTLVQGPEIEEFEVAFARRLGASRAITASYGRMAFHYILKALQLAPGSEIVFPALTFWVVPEIARVAGLKPVFADVDPETFNLDPVAFEQAITPRTRAVVPTHLYGLSCDMKEILAIARRHRLFVIEDCAHSLGACYDGREIGTFGDASFFSFQTLKPLNTYGGGMALVRAPDLAERVATLAKSEPWPSEKRVLNRLRLGRVQRTFTRPSVFSWTGFPILWVASWTKARPDVYLWENIRPLIPLPESYTERYSNVQAALGLAALAHLEVWMTRTQRNAKIMDEVLRDVPGAQVPYVPPGRTHVYYQYCLRVRNRDDLIRRCIRRGVDLETLHVDVCTELPLFGENPATPNADMAARAVQLPVYASLSQEQAHWIGRHVRDALLQECPVPRGIPQGVD